MRKKHTAKEGKRLQQRAIKVRCYPTPEQEELLQQTFGCCRFYWNKALADAEEFWAAANQFFVPTPAKYKTAFPFLAEVDSLALANVQIHLNDAFARYRNKDLDAGFPVYKSKKRSRKSYTTNCQYPKNGRPSIRISDGAVNLPKIGLLRINLYRAPMEGWKLKSVTVSQNGAGKYFVSLLYEYEEDVPTPTLDAENAIGLDYKASTLYVDSDGQNADMPKWFKDASNRLAVLQRRFSHMEKGSRNWDCAKARIAELHEHVSNQRKDFQHKQSYAIAKRYDLVCVEDVSIREQIRERPYRAFRKSTYDNGWYSFTQKLAYKLEAQGKRLIKIDRSFPSSQTCSVCGSINGTVKDDRIRRWVCPYCGAEHDRDHNAAINILREGVRLFLSEQPVPSA